MVKKIFYARARDEKPYLRLNRLKKGMYQEVNYLSLRSFIRFTDIGKALWANLEDLGEDPVIEVVKFSMIEEDKGWTIFMYDNGLGILLSSQRYNHFGKYPKSFFLTIEMEGEEALIKKFTKKLVHSMDYKPWGEMDWDSFTKKTDLDRLEAEKTWSQCLVSGSVRLAVDGKDKIREQMLENLFSPLSTENDEHTSLNSSAPSTPKRRRRRRIS